MKYFAFIFLLFSIGCAPIAPVPGGTNSINPGFYKSEGEFLEKVEQLTPGMAKEEVFEIMTRKENEFIALSRNEVVLALYGTDNLQEKGQAHKIQDLNGYKLTFSKVKRNHGFNSPLSMKTKEKGFSYTVFLVFSGEHLIEEPIIAGGDVSGSKSSTLFDYLNPGRIVNGAF